MTTNALQATIDAEAKSITAFNGHEQPWQDCPQEPTHRRGRYCEHQVVELANHLVRNRVQREDAQKQALVTALEAIAAPSDDPSHASHCVQHRRIARRALAALKGLEPAQPPSTRLFRNEAGVLEEYRTETP